MSLGAQLGFLVENIGGGEIVVIAFIALVVLGPDRIPELARGAGRMINNLRKLSTNLTGDMSEVMNDPAMQPIRELGEFAARPRQKLAQYAFEAEAEARAEQAAQVAAGIVEPPATGDATEPAAPGSDPSGDAVDTSGDADDTSGDPDDHGQPAPK